MNNVTVNAEKAIITKLSKVLFKPGDIPNLTDLSLLKYLNVKNAKNKITKHRDMILAVAPLRLE